MQANLRKCVSCDTTISNHCKTSDKCRKCWKISIGTPKENLWKHVKKTETCWLWTGAKTISGYGCMRVNGENIVAHRVSWEILNGDIPNGLCVLHKCDVRPCIRPDHLFLGTRGDNARDAMSKGRHVFFGRRNEKLGIPGS